MIKNKINHLKTDRNREGYVAQWIEQPSDVGEDVGSKHLRKSHHAREHPETSRNKANKNKKEKQAYSLDKEPLRRRGISHEFKTIVGPNQNPQHNNYNDNNYLKVSINSLVFPTDNTVPHQVIF